MNEQQQSEPTPLQQLVNVPEVIKAFGRSYEIRKFTLGPFTRAMEFVAPIGYLLQWINDLPREEDEKGNVKLNASSGELMQLTLRAAAISGPSIFGLISIATEEPIEWLEQQDAMDGLKIFAKVVEKNLDFFTPENVERITAMIGSFQQSTQKLSGE